MTRIVYILKELSRNLYRNPGTAMGSFLSLMLLFLLFDLYWIAAGTSERFYTRLLSELKMEVFIAEETADSTLPIIKAALGAIDGVQSVEYISREKAREELSRLVGVDLLVGYDTLNPLPRSYVLDFSPDFLSTVGLADIESEIGKQAGISQVFYSKQWLQKAESTRTIILNIGMTLGALILLTALISSVNSIRLSSRARAIGFQQMRLLGAGKLYLAVPFLIEGFLLGGLSAVTGWLLIFYAKQKITFTQFELVLPTIEEIIIFCGITALLGIISGYLGIRKLLR